MKFFVLYKSILTWNLDNFKVKYQTLFKKIKNICKETWTIDLTSDYKNEFFRNCLIIFTLMFNNVFIFILLKILWSDYYFYLTYIFFFFSSWYLFFKVSFFSALETTQSTDKLVIKDRKSKNLDYYLFIRYYLFLLLLFLFFFFSTRYNTTTSLWQHFKYTNFNLNVTNVILIVNIVFLFVINSYNFNSEVLKFDFFFALLNLSLFLILLLFTNSFYSFFFVIELNSLLLLYKFLMSRLWYKDKNSNKLNNTKTSKFSPRIFLNMLFFQFWSSFFSSVFFVYILIFLLFIFGTSEWGVINYLNHIKSNSSFTTMHYYILFSLFLFSFFIKLGLTPIHIYKIEIYKGISFLSIFFYSTYYFLIFFFYFITLLLMHLSSFHIYTLNLLSLLVIFGFIYTVSLLFDINYIKAFFAYSSIINSLNFLIITISLLF